MSQSPQAHARLLREGVEKWNTWRDQNQEVIPYLVATDLSRANLEGANLKDADLRGADLERCQLKGAQLAGADLRHADLSNADLTDADLKQAKLQGANLFFAKLKGAQLEGANLHGARLKNADLTEVTYNEKTVFRREDVEVAKNPPDLLRYFGDRLTQNEREEGQLKDQEEELKKKYLEEPLTSLEIEEIKKQLTKVEQQMLQNEQRRKLHLKERIGNALEEFQKPNGITKKEKEVNEILFWLFLILGILALTATVWLTFSPDRPKTVESGYNYLLTISPSVFTISLMAAFFGTAFRRRRIIRELDQERKRLDLIGAAIKGHLEANLDKETTLGLLSKSMNQLLEKAIEEATVSASPMLAEDAKEMQSLIPSVKAWMQAKAAKSDKS